MARQFRTQNLIGGLWQSAADGRTITVTDPATDAVLAEVPRATSDDVARAIDCAAKALPAWSAVAAADRRRVLRRLVGLVEEHAEDLAEIVTAENGKPLSEARAEIAYGLGFLDFAADEACRIYGETVPASTPAKRIFVSKQPIGVTAAIAPWNFPFAMITRKLGPALATGCTQVIKPAAQTPLTALSLAELLIEAGVPVGAVNVVTTIGPRFGDAVLADPRVRKVSFTGSTEVGQWLIERSARNVTRLSLELGGHAPLIVLDDADLEVAAAGASQLTVGAGSTDPDIGPLIDDAAVSKVTEHVDDAVAKGGKLLVGGKTRELASLADRFFEPTVTRDATDDMLAHTEETFGPVAAVTSFRTDDEAIERANSLPFGLAAYVFGRDATRLLSIVERLESGVVGVNDGVPSTAQAPFGGMRLSGVGREGGKYVMDEYLETKYVSFGLT